MINFIDICTRKFYPYCRITEGRQNIVKELTEKLQQQTSK